MCSTINGQHGSRRVCFTSRRTSTVARYHSLALPTPCHTPRTTSVLPTDVAADDMHARVLLTCDMQQVEDYGDDAIFVHVYGPEPHPASPDINFDSGRLLPNFWSVRRQPVTYDDRLDRARNIRSITHPDQVSGTLF